LKDQDKRPIPRRANRRPWWFPGWVQAVVTVLLISLAAAVSAYATALAAVPSTTTTVTRVEYRDWPVYVIDLPNCRDMIKSYDRLFDKSITNEQQLLKVAKLAVDGANDMDPAKLIEAGKVIDQSEKLTPQLKAVRLKALDNQKACMRI
jgi:hypothetical protein